MKITVNIPPALSHSYPILIDSTLLQHPNDWLPKNLYFSRIVIITDNRVKKLYARDFSNNLINQGHKVLLLAFPAGEQYKNAEIKKIIDAKMLNAHCDRNTLCLALGGGVVGDLAGFVAATYMRGIPYIQIPTTLLAMVDSSIGGKTAINTAQGKNLIGVFYQPQAVIADLNCVQTLSLRHIRNGLVEILKIFVTCDAKAFIYLHKNLKRALSLDETVIRKLICKAIKIKADIVASDERENNRRAILNFGHTIGHALENVSNYKLLHGEAVAMGILLEVRIALILGFLPENNYQQIAEMLAYFGFSNKNLKKFAINKIIRATQLDKKMRREKVHYVLLSSIGKVVEKDGCYVHPVADEVVRRAHAWQ